MRRAGTGNAGTTSGSGRTRWIVALLLLGATAVIYGRVVSFEFVNLDDSDYVRQNGHVLAGWTRDGFAWAFTTFAAGNWHPLTWLSLMADAQIGAGAPWAFHLANLLLHAGNAVLLFLLFDRMTGATRPSALVAALFAVHPLHVESVAWVAERKDVLSTAFGLLAFHAWLGWVRRPGPARAVLAWGAYAASLLAKPMLVSFPLLLLLLDAWPLARVGSWKERVREKLPFFALAAASCVVTMAAQSGGGMTRSLAQYPLPGRMANAAVAYVLYLVKAVWPAKLAVFYPYPYEGIPAAETAGAVLLLAGVTFACVRARITRPYLLVGWLWYLITLVPVIGIVQIGSQAMADRYSYLPLVGPFVMVAWGLKDAARRIAGSVLATVAVLVLAAMAWRQAGYWRDSVTLFEHALAVTDENAPAHDALASAYFDRGDADRALLHSTEALRIAPGLIDAQGKQVRSLIAKGRLDEALARASEYAAARPDDSGMQVNLGLVAMFQKRYDEAASRFEGALRLDPEDTGAHLNLGALLLSQGRKDEAVAHFEEAVRLRPGDATARRALERARATAP